MCGNQQRCKAITKYFSAVKDIRGSFVRLPKTPDPDSRMTPHRLDTAKYIKRQKAILRIDDNVLTVDKRHRSTKVSAPLKTRTTAQEHEQAISFIALWHYHPFIIKQWHDKQKRRIKIHKTMFVSAVDVQNKMGGEVASRYTSADKKDGTTYFIVPTYDAASAEKDAAETAHYYHTHITTPREILGKTPPTAASTTVATPAEQILVRQRDDDVVNPGAPTKRQ